MADGIKRRNMNKKKMKNLVFSYQNVGLVFRERKNVKRAIRMKWKIFSLSIFPSSFFITPVKTRKCLRMVHFSCCCYSVFMKIHMKIIDFSQLFFFFCSFVLNLILLYFQTFWLFFLYRWFVISFRHFLASFSIFLLPLIL